MYDNIFTVLLFVVLFFYTHSHRSRDEDRISKAGPLPLPAKMVEEMPKEQSAAREEKQLPPLPGQRSLHMDALWSNILSLCMWACAQAVMSSGSLSVVTVPSHLLRPAGCLCDLPVRDTLLWWQFCVCVCFTQLLIMLWSPQSPSLCTLNLVSLTWTCLLVRQTPPCPASHMMTAFYGASHQLAQNCFRDVENETS